MPPPSRERLLLALDWAGRLLGAGLFLYLLLGEWRALAWLWSQPGPAGTPAFWVPIAARLALIAFLALASLCFLIRAAPIARSPSLRARAVAVLATILLTVALRWLPPAKLSLAEQIAATTLVALGNLMAVAALLALGRSFSILPQARTLVTRGPYRFVRHPMYLAHGISVLGAVWFYRSPAAVPLLLLHLGLQLWRMEEEERLLGQVFPEYADYRRRTWRLLPGVY